MARFVLGIGGYMGSGKTLAGRFFESKGALFIDADAVVSELYQPGRDGHRKIVNFFGEEFLKKDGQIDRAKLGKFVFSDPNKLKILNHTIHPLVTNEIQKKLDAAGDRFVVIEASYFEPQQLGRFIDALLWIDCRLDLLLRRALERPGMTEKRFRSILLTQIKPEKVDYRLKNEGNEEDFYAALEEVRQKMKLD